MNLWNIEKNGFDRPDIELHGSKYLIGNGFMGYRGTMEEYSAEQLVAVNLAGFFDLAEGSNWRESVNAPNPLYTVVSVDGVALNLSCSESVSHKQALNIKSGIHCRETVFSVAGVNITIKAERFVSMVRENIIALKYSVYADKDVDITLKTGIDKNIWNIFGTHLNFVSEVSDNNSFKLNCETVQLKNELKVYETVVGLNSFENDNLLHSSQISLKADEEFTFTKFGGIYHSQSLEIAEENFSDAVNARSQREILCRSGGRGKGHTWRSAAGWIRNRSKRHRASPTAR